MQVETTVAEIDDDELAAENLDEIPMQEEGTIVVTTGGSDDNQTAVALFDPDVDDDAAKKKIGFEDIEVPRPRHAKFSAMPFCYGLIFGVGGLFMIYGVAANLGPEQTKLWLITSIISLAIKIFFADPIKIVAAAALLQCAERFESNTLQRVADMLGGDADD